MNEEIEKMNLDYLKIINSKEYKLGKMIIESAAAIKKHNMQKVKKEMIPLFQSAQLSRFANRKGRFKQVCSTECHERLAVYMALFGNYDSVYEPMVIDSECDYYIFTDQKINKESVWNPIELSEPDRRILHKLSDNERNRYFKILGYRKFRNYNYSLYLDTNLQIFGQLHEMIDYCRNEYGMALYNHPARDCVYDEIKACLILKKTDKKNAKIQAGIFQKAGMPKHYGMCECNAILRENNNSKCLNIMKEWWCEYINSLCKRDQIAFSYVMWKNDIEFNQIGCLGDNINYEGKFRRYEHINS